MKDLIQYTQNGNRVSIPGTNQFLDFFISANCLTDEGVHAGCIKWARRIFPKIERDLDRGEVVKLSGHSLGGSIAQALGYLLFKCGYMVEVDTNGSYPVFAENSIPCFKGSNYIYGNDPVPGLFPWFNYANSTTIMEIGPDRKWWKINFIDHVRY